LFSIFPLLFFFFSVINVNEYILDLSHTNSLIGQPPVSSLKNPDFFLLVVS
jgi:hypothetical protein